MAFVLSLLLPGLGHLYVGDVASGLAVFLVNLLSPAVLAAVWAVLAFDVKTYLFADKGLSVAIRLVAAIWAAVSAARTRKAPLKHVPVGMYGFILLGSLAGSTALAKLVQRWAPPPADLAVAAFGIEAGEYVQTRKIGPAGEPQVGALVVYLADAPDAGLVNPLAPIHRDAFLARVVSKSAEKFEVSDRDASVPLDDYLGEAVGVIFSKTPENQVRWERIGTRPNSQ